MIKIEIYVIDLSQWPISFFIIIYICIRPSSIRYFSTYIWFEQILILYRGFSGFQLNAMLCCPNAWYKMVFMSVIETPISLQIFSMPAVSFAPTFRYKCTYASILPFHESSFVRAKVKEKQKRSIKLRSRVYTLALPFVLYVYLWR